MRNSPSEEVRGAKASPPSEEGRALNDKSGAQTNEKSTPKTEISVRESPFMPYHFAARPPGPEAFGPNAKAEMPYEEALAHWFGRENVSYVDLDIRAMRRDQFPSVHAARHPDTMLQPSFQDLDFSVLPDTLAGRKKVFASIREVIGELMDRWVALGLPVKRDAVRGIDLPDTGALASAIIASPRGKEARTVAQSYDEVCQLVASLDNLPKFTIQRYVPTGWYLQDMSANHVTVAPVMKRAVAILARIARRLLHSDAGKVEMQAVLDEYSDPFGTAVGWPIFASSLDLTDEIRDDAKIAILSQFDGVFKGMSWGDSPATHKAMIERLKARVPAGPLQDFPLAYLVNRRSRLGGKFNPDWALRSGVVATRELFGAPYARIAQAAPWMGNLIQGTIFPYFKALRKMLTGCYHTQELVDQYLPRLKKGDTFVLESDISQYDLNFAIEITDAIDEVIAQLTNKPALALSVLRAIRRTPILMPNPGNMEGRSGGIYVTGDIMLPSGIKLTAEYGTLGNVLVTICYQLEKGERETDIVAYWDAATNNSRARWLMQGDDKAVIGESLPQLVKAITQEASLYPLIGTTAKVEICDRFLQKHMYRGRVLPVASRFVQQRLGNETAPESFEQMMMGLTTAAAGINGYDPMSESGELLSSRRLSGQAADIQLKVVRLVEQSMKMAAVPFPPALKFISELLAERPQYKTLKRLHEEASRALIAKMGIDGDDPELTGVSKMLLYFDRHKYSASVADFYAELMATSPEWRRLTAEFEGKKVAFADLAYKTLHLPKTLFLTPQ